MLTASSPIVFPQSSSPVAPKRPRPHDVLAGQPKPRIPGPFLIDDDEDDDEDEDGSNGAVVTLDTGAQVSEPLAKKRMTQDPRETNAEQVIPDGQFDTPVLVDDDAATQLSAINSQDLPANIEPSVSQSESTSWMNSNPLFLRPLFSNLTRDRYTLRKCDGQTVSIKERKQEASVSYESMVAARSRTKEGRAKRSYYGIEIHDLINTATKELANAPKVTSVAPDAPVQSVEAAPTGKKSRRSMLWTEKYRARNFMDLCGDDGTNRLVLRWLKKWDPVVFPGATKAKAVIPRRPGARPQEEEKPHRKILMLTGPPGLGKTTLAHVCARQAGYEVLEINASDDRSKDVVKNQIRTTLGTESVKTVTRQRGAEASAAKLAKPACVVVDEVDGVVTGSGPSGEGGFVKALIDLVLTDQRNSSGTASATTNHGGSGRKQKKGDDFRMMRPLILICNDVYHPSLRPLRQSNLAEIIHVGRPTLDAVVGRLKAVFEKEGIPCDKDAARKLCEAAWGITSGIDAKKGAESTVEGDLRGVMVVGEWVAGRFRAATRQNDQRLTRQWIEGNIMHDLQGGAAGSRGLGRGSAKDIVSRLFQEGGGFPKQALDLSETKNSDEQPKTELGFSELRKRYAMERLRQMADTCGEISHILTEVFAEYPNREYNDDCYLTKPNQAYDWLHFHDLCQSRLYSSQEWELAPYLSQPVLACHDLFASPKRHHAAGAGYDRRWGGDAADDAAAAPLPFSGPRADWMAREAEKQNRAQLQAMQGRLSPSLTRSFRSAEDLAAEFLPYLMRIVSPDVKPVVVGGSQGSTASVRKETERAMVRRAADVLADVGIELHRGKIEDESVSNRAPQYVYRMEPYVIPKNPPCPFFFLDIDALATFETAASLVSSHQPVRFAVRQVLDQELRLATAMRENAARQARFLVGGPLGRDAAAAAAGSKPSKGDKKPPRDGVDGVAAVKRDFFGRVVEVRPPLARVGGEAPARAEKQHKVWVTFHEGLNNAVRKPISLQEFMRGL
ncbi:hypothetical protein S40293_02838 [Stachybotrys chartarum IBT 40293]|nr:hypothetical protein S40293_02838 [Stachybotrys chartarum IBT 40293]